MLHKNVGIINGKQIVAKRRRIEIAGNEFVKCERNDMTWKTDWIEQTPSLHRTRMGNPVMYGQTTVGTTGTLHGKPVGKYPTGQLQESQKRLGGVYWNCPVNRGLTDIFVGDLYGTSWIHWCEAIGYQMPLSMRECKRMLLDVWRVPRNYNSATRKHVMCFVV